MGKKQLFRKLCNAATISKPLFRRTTISQHYNFTKLQFHGTTISKTTISHNYYFEKLLMAKQPITDYRLPISQNYFTELQFRGTLFHGITISNNYYFAKLLVTVLRSYCITNNYIYMHIYISLISGA